ncbi:MAG: hypothetical protein WBN72_10270 [Nitrososphaeraceae archaeon]
MNKLLYLVTFIGLVLKYIAVNRYALPCTVLVIMTIIISGLDIQPANYGVLGELPSRSTWGPISSVTTDLNGASNMSTNSNSSQTGNTTMNIPSNDTILNSNIANDSSSLNSNISNKSTSFNTTMPNQLPPESINGSKVGKI